MDAHLNTALFGYDKRDTDEYIRRLQDKISEHKQLNDQLLEKIRRLEFKNEDLSAELKAKTEILKMKRESLIDA